jgi:hypothetical protein
MNHDELAQRDRLRAERKMLRAKRQLQFLFFGALITIGLILYSYWRDGQGEVSNTVTEEAAAPVASPDSLPPGAPAIADAPRRPDNTVFEKRAEPKDDQGNESKPSSGDGKTFAPAASSLAESARGTPTSVEVMSLWERYMNAKTPGQYRILMYDKPDLDQRFTDFYERRKGTNPVSAEKMVEAEVMISNERWRVVSYKSKSRNSGVLHAGFRRDHLGRVRLDWESLVGYSEMDWPEFREKRVTEPKLFRAYMMADDYYNFEFADEEKFIGVRLFSPDGAWAFSGFCEREGPEGKVLQGLLAANGEAAAGEDIPRAVKNLFPVTVRLAFPEKSISDHCVWIREVVSGQWFVK